MTQLGTHRCRVAIQPLNSRPFIDGMKQVVRHRADFPSSPHCTAHGTRAASADRAKMNKRSVRWWLIAAASVCCAAVPASVNSALADGPRSARASDIDLSDPDVEAIVELADRFPEAIASGDLARVQDFYTQDVIYMAQGMHDTAGRENVWAGDFLKVNIVHVEVHLQEVKVFGDMAFDRAVFTTTVVPRAGGRVRSFSGRLLEILKKQSGLWKSYRVMVNSA